MKSKFEDAFTAPKTCWTIINRLLYNKRIPAIPPLLVDGNFVSDCNKKVNLFNKFFLSVCTPIKISSTPPHFSHRRNSRIHSFHATEKDMLLIRKSLDPTRCTRM